MTYPLVGGALSGTTAIVGDWTNVVSFTGMHVWNKPIGTNVFGRSRSGTLAIVGDWTNITAFIGNRTWSGTKQIIFNITDSWGR